jgi:hypothetical protein
MARSEHNREAYRLLFGYVGAGLQVLAAILVLMSLPIMPIWMFLGLAAVYALSAFWSWKRFASNFMMPTFVGSLQAVAWMLLVGVGVGIMEWT